MDTADVSASRFPTTTEEFVKAVNEDQESWYLRFVEANKVFNQTTEDNATLRERLSTADTKRAQGAEKINSLRHELGVKQGIIDYQRSEIDRLQAQLNAPSASVLATDPTPPPVPVTPASSSTLSERVPDPACFKGDQSDLARFQDQIRSKLIINGDRFRTPQARNGYVLSRLEGLAYQQVHPHVRGGIPQFGDYEEILELLQRSFGDPNLASRSTQKLHQLRQLNKDFNVFYAEFQRLALESELDDLSLVRILERAISKELRHLLVASQPSKPGLHALASHLQELDTRQRYLFSELRPEPAPLRYQSPAPPRPQPAYPATPRAPQRATEPMDLSQTRRNRSDKETGNCFRCHRPGHRIRDCPHPDNRPRERRNSAHQLRIMGINDQHQQPLAILPPPPPSVEDANQAIEGGSENGVRLS